MLISLPILTLWAHWWNTTIVCEAWPVRRQTSGYLPSLRWYQIYTAWWQLKWLNSYYSWADIVWIYSAWPCYLKTTHSVSISGFSSSSCFVIVARYNIADDVQLQGKWACILTAVCIQFVCDCAVIQCNCGAGVIMKVLYVLCAFTVLFRWQGGGAVVLVVLKTVLNEN